MNCCDANGRCTCSTGTPRTCDELGVCQGLTPPCTYADGKTVACPTPLHLAPGAVEGYRAPFLGTPAQRRELVRAEVRRPVDGGVRSVRLRGRPDRGVAAMTRRKDGLSVVAIRAWRYMRDEGGWFRPHEVAAALQLDMGSQRANSAVTKAMQALATRGHAALHPGQLDKQRPRYGVTTRCSAPALETMTPSPAHKPAPMPEAT